MRPAVTVLLATVSSLGCRADEAKDRPEQSERAAEQGEEESPKAEPDAPPVFALRDFSLTVDGDDPDGAMGVTVKVEILRKPPEEYFPYVHLRCAAMGGTVWDAVAVQPDRGDEPPDRTLEPGDSEYTKYEAGAVLDTRRAVVRLGVDDWPDLCSVVMQEGFRRDDAPRYRRGHACWRGGKVTLTDCSGDPALEAKPRPGSSVDVQLRVRANEPRWKLTMATRAHRRLDAEANKAYVVGSCEIGGHWYVHARRNWLGQSPGSVIEPGDWVVNGMNLPDLLSIRPENPPAQCSLRVVVADETVYEACIREGVETRGSCGVPTPTRSPAAPTVDAFALRDFSLRAAQRHETGSHYWSLQTEIELLRPLTKSSIAVSTKCRSDGRERKVSHGDKPAAPHLFRPGERFVDRTYPFMRQSIPSAFDECEFTVWGGPEEHTTSNRFVIGKLCYERGRTGDETYRCD